MRLRSATGLTTNTAEGPRTQVGALPWRISKKGALRILLITSRSGRQWIIPKGWPVPGKTDGDSAAQEALEEAGVIGHLMTTPLGEFRYVKRGNDGGMQRVRVFPLKVRGTLVQWREDKERKRRWFSLEEAIETVSNEELARLIETSAELNDLSLDLGKGAAD